MQNILFILCLIIAIIYPFIISIFISKNNGFKEKDIKKILINIGKIILVSIIFLLVIIVLLDKYDNLIPSSSSNSCINLGGFTYKCKCDSILMPTILVSIGILIIIHHFICKKFIYKIFKYSSKWFSYLLMFIYMLLMYSLSFVLLVLLSGLFRSVYFDNIIIEILRVWVIISPFALFIISTIILAIKNKK